MANGQQSMPPDSGGHANVPPELKLEFLISDIGQRVEISDLTEVMHRDITQKVDERDIIGVQVVPQRWPRKVQILCAHQAAKDCLMIRGVDIYGRHIDLNEAGHGVIKVLIQDAPIEMPNEVIKGWIGQFGTVTDLRNENLTVRGRRTNWRTGTRHAYVKMLKQPIPPSAKIRYRGEDVTVSTWHYGQSHMKCRFCQQIVPKDHKCDRGPQKKCYNCGSDTHIKVNCPQGKTCFKCGSKDHLARDCVPQVNNTNEFPLLPTRPNSTSKQSILQDARSGGGLVANKLNGESSARSDEAQKVESRNDEKNDSAEDSVEIHVDENDDIHDHQLDVLLIGGSNCIDMNLDGDDQLTLNVSSLIQGGLKIDEMTEKLEEISEEKKKSVEVVVVNVGACNFPAEEDENVNRDFTQYEEGIHTILHDCPKAHVIMSSILPRAGAMKERTNSQIGAFNKMLEKLAEEELDLHFCNNSVYFEQENGVIESLYRDADTFGMHVNTDGRERLATSITAVTKELFFIEKYIEAAGGKIKEN